MALGLCLLRAALLHDADEQNVVLHAFYLFLFEPLFARRAFGREVAPRAPPAERVSAGHGHRLAHQEETEGTLQQIHGGWVMSPEEEGKKKKNVPRGQVCVCVCVFVKAMRTENASVC